MDRVQNQYGSASTGLPAACRSSDDIRTNARKPASGFTLLETLTALVILTLVLTSLLGTFSNSLRIGRTSDQYAIALNLAQSLLAEQVGRRALKSGTTKGKFNQLDWAVNVLQEDADHPPERQWRLYKIIVTIFLPSGRRVRLETLKLSALRDGHDVFIG